MIGIYKVNRDVHTASGSRRRLFVLLLLLFAAVFPEANAAEVKLRTVPIPLPEGAMKGNLSMHAGWAAILTISGEIRTGDSAQLAHFLDTHPDEKYLQIESLGGDLAETLAIADLIAKNRLRVDVVPSRYCGAACVLIWLAGNRPGKLSTANSSEGNLGFFGLPLVSNSDFMSQMEKLFDRQCVPERLRTGLLQNAPNQRQWQKESDARAALCESP